MIPLWVGTQQNEGGEGNKYGTRRIIDCLQQPLGAPQLALIPQDFIHHRSRQWLPILTGLTWLRHGKDQGKSSVLSSWAVARR